MAALGGLLLGLGLGVGARGRREQRDAQAASDLKERVFALDEVAIPWLRAHATSLGVLPETVTRRPSDDPLETAQALIETIVRCERAHVRLDGVGEVAL